MKFKKGIAAFGTVMVLTASMMMYVQADSIEGGVGAYKISAGSNITLTSATCYTRASLRQRVEGQPNVYVSAAYDYVDTETLQIGTMSDSKGASGDATVGFSVSGNRRSVKVTASHSASYEGQTWQGSTKQVYPQ